MQHAVVLIPVFAVFIPALLLPGPDFVAVVRSAMTHGARAGLLTTLGVTTGLCFYATLSLIGLSAILAEYQWLTWAVRAAGGSYLVYLGVRLALTRAEPEEAGGVAPPAPDRSILFGFLVTLTNPKAIVLFASVFATAIGADTPLWLMGLMVGLVGLSSLVWYALVSCFVSSGPVLRRFQRARHRIERVAGACFVGLGLKVLADARNPVTP